MLKISLFRPTVKICDHSLYTQIAIKKIYLFFPPILRMGRKNVNFGDKMIKEKWLLQKQESNQDRWHWC